jgi:hypothetical protein
LTGISSSKSRIDALQEALRRKEDPFVNVEGDPVFSRPRYDSTKAAFESGLDFGEGEIRSKEAQSSVKTGLSQEWGSP